MQDGETYKLEETGETCQVHFQGLFPCILNPVGTVSDAFKLFQQRLEVAQNRFADATAHITYLGPFREVPKRTYRFPGGVPQGVGPGGTRAPEILADDVLRRKGVLRDAIGEWFRNYLGGWLLDVAEQGDTFALVLRDPNNPTLSINIADVGTGIAQVLPIVVQRQFATLSNKPNDVEIVEQPELHLHPGVHGDLADLYIEAVNRASVRFVIETHSENFLLRIRRRIAEGHLESSKVMIYWVKDRTDAIPRIQPIHIDRSGEVDTWPAGVFSEDFQEVRAMRKAQQKIE